jgi:hypothetical protein
MALIARRVGEPLAQFSLTDPPAMNDVFISYAHIDDQPMIEGTRCARTLNAQTFNAQVLEPTKRCSVSTSELKRSAACPDSSGLNVKR